MIVALNGTVAAKGKDVHRGTVVKIKLRIPNGHTPVVTSNRVIANGFTEHTGPNALVVGPTGVGLGSHGPLYVADSSNNQIAAIPNALTRTSILAGGAKTVTKGRTAGCGPARPVVWGAGVSPAPTRPSSRSGPAVKGGPTGLTTTAATMTSAVAGGQQPTGRN